MEFLQDLANSSEFPMVSAFFLGLMTAISPCPLATNISAIGFISKDLGSSKRVFLNGIIYTLGRAISYTVIATILIVLLKEGGSIFKIQRTISTYGELFIGPLLIIIGVFMLGLINLNLPFSRKLATKAEQNASNGSWKGALMLGIVFAMAFCPYSGVLFFGGLIPLSVTASTGYILPLIFAIATGLPVIIFAWILAYSVSSFGKVYNNLKTFEKWFRLIVGVLFILFGIYYIFEVYF
jgi:cytochrome c biogenesis protein CcdA